MKDKLPALVRAWATPLGGLTAPVDEAEITTTPVASLNGAPVCIVQFWHDVPPDIYDKAFLYIVFGGDLDDADICKALTTAWEPYAAHPQAPHLELGVFVTRKDTTPHVYIELRQRDNPKLFSASRAYPLFTDFYREPQ